SLNGSGTNNQGALVSYGTNNVWQGNVSYLSQNQTNPQPVLISVPNAADTLTFGTASTAGVVSGNTNMTKIGKGTLVYAGNNNNTLVGTTTILDGTLKLNKTSAWAFAQGSAFSTVIIGDGTAGETPQVVLAGSNQIQGNAVVQIANNGLLA